MFYTESSTNTNLVVGLSLLVIGIIIAVGFLILVFYLRNKKQSNAFMRINKESQTIWEFTKKNFPVFASLFGVVIAVTGLFMLI